MNGGFKIWLTTVRTIMITYNLQCEHKSSPVKTARPFQLNFGNIWSRLGKILRGLRNKLIGSLKMLVSRKRNDEKNRICGIRDLITVSGPSENLNIH